MVTAPDTTSRISDLLCNGAPHLFECAPAPHGAVRVNTSLLYPDGGEVQVWVTEQDGEYVLTDYGEATAWLRMNMWEREFTPRQEALIDEVCRHLEVERDGYVLVTRRPEAEMVIFAVLYLAEAIVRVADISYTFRSEGSPGS